MKRTIRVELSEKSIDDAVAQIEAYKERLNYKLEEYIRQLGERGKQTVDDNMSNILGDSDSSHFTDMKDISRSGSRVDGTLFVQGADLAFIEFGAGVHYNGAVGTAAYDWAASQGYTIGSYGNGNGAKDYWYYRKDGVSHRSQGTKANAPLYHASETIRQDARRIARDVFGS